MSFPSRTASSSPSNGMTTTTGPKISSCAIRMSLATSANIVGSMKLPAASSGSAGRLPPWTTVAPSALPISTYS